ncbi:CAF17-like 4Fe-4S cluster assembly/insertion protein YgfZ [Sphingomonas bacterium]|uniref:CAF17-like 4Fe-4S cluster assembly/insertion protein YgfZ n=1 Tax=Sphingomonas bacterium TaxID=1895847 RepID=UPI0020C65E2B|nr:folate-binding protein [Sphingomonas bacterium]
MDEATPAAGATMLADRSVLRLGGAEARPFLQGLVTQDVTAVAPGAPRWAGLLTPQGKALFDFMLWDGGDGALLIDVEAAQAEAIARRLAMYRLRRAVTIEPADVLVHWSGEEGPGRVPDPRLAGLGWRWLGPPTAPAAGWRRHRLALGVVEGVGELGQDRTLWLECNAAELGGVSFDKGCYVGQENTARMHYRGKVGRRLVVAAIGPEGDRVRARYPELGMMVEHRRVDALGDALVPSWLAPALAAGAEPASEPAG